MSRPAPARLVLTALIASALALTTTTPATASDLSAEPLDISSDTQTAGSAQDPDKSFAFFAGKNTTESGHTLIGGFGHEPSSHWLEIVPAQTHEEGSSIVVGATEEADMPGVLTEIPQVKDTARYITSNYSEFAGFPSPLTNGGLNEHGVAGRDVWSNSREELWEMTPPDQTGPSYSDLSRIAMERATSAREAVEILGALIDEHGYTTYGGNSHLFADADEGWVFIEFSGGEGLWAAERLGPDDVRVSYPGYIQDFPTDALEGSDTDYLGSANLVDVALEQGWWTDDGSGMIDLQEVYGQPFPTEEFAVGQDADPDDPAPYRNPTSLEAELDQMDALNLQDAMRYIRDPRWSDDRSGYGQVAELRDDVADPGLHTLWVATTAAATAPYIPVMIGSQDVPVEYSQHRYLTAGASSTYLSPEYAEQEATEYATQTYKRLMYATCSRPDEYLGEVTANMEGMEAESIVQWRQTIESAGERYSADDVKGAEQELTSLTIDRADEGLALGKYLLEDLLTRSAENGGIHVPDVEVPAGTTASARSLDMALDGISSRDRLNCDMGGGWADGSAADRQGTYGSATDVVDYRTSSADDAGQPVIWWSIGAGAVGIAVGALAMFAFSRSRRTR